MQKNCLIILLMGTLLIVMIAAMGCDSKGPAEKIGENVDQSVESVKDSVEDMGDKITGKGPAEKIGEHIDEAVDTIEKNIESKNN